MLQAEDPNRPASATSFNNSDLGPDDSWVVVNSSNHNS